jgi:hypothetical protein
MATIIFYKCSSCRMSLGSHDAYYSIGEPFKACPGCNTVNVIVKSRNEWDLKTPSQRFKNRAHMLFVLALVCGGVTLLASMGLEFLGVTKIKTAIPFCAPVGLFVGYIWIAGEFNRAIKDSRARMRDERYISILKQLKIYGE